MWSKHVLIQENDLSNIVTHLGLDAQGLKGAKIFLTGGTGFFGKWLTESFAYLNLKLDLGANLTVLTRNPSLGASHFQKKPWVLNSGSVSFYQGDMVDFCFPSGHFSHIIHAATSSDTSYFREKPMEAFESTLNGVKRALDFSNSCQAKKFLYISSGAVYGKQKSIVPIKLEEDFPYSSNVGQIGDSYACAKQAAENLCFLYQRQFGTAISIARCFTLLGPYLPLNANYAAGNFIYDASKGKPIEVKGDGSAIRSFLYAGDLVAWLWKILLLRNAGGVYNVGSDQEISIGQLATLVGQISNTGVTFGQKVNSTLRENYLPNISKAKSELGVEVWTPLDVAIRKTLQWARVRKE